MANSLASGQKPTGVTDLDSSQTLSNKTLDSSSVVSGSTVTAASIQSPVRADVKKDTLANLQTYALTASNGQLCFATDAKKMYQVLDAALAEVGSGQGGINYISNPDFELNADGWTGDTNLTIARSTSAPLRGDASGLISKTAVDASGQVVKIPFTIESADLAKKLYISFDKDASDANYADADLRVEIIKDPNGTPVTIRCNAEDILGGKGSHLAWFQSDASILEYELVFKCNSSNATAYSVKIDNVSVGPREVSYGSAITDWKSYTPTFSAGFGTVSSETARYRRVGDHLEVQVFFTTGTVAASLGTISLPDNLTIDSTKITKDTLNNQNSPIVGYGYLDAGTAINRGFNVLTSTASDATVVYTSAIDGSTAGSKLLPTNVNNGFGNSANVSLNFRVPIQGWSSNSIQSEDIGNREIRVRGAGNGGTAITASVTPIDFTEVEDTTNSWNGTTFTTPETGDYSISGGVLTTASTTSSIAVYIDTTGTGSSYVLNKFIGLNQGAGTTKSFSGTVTLEKSWLLQLRSDNAATLSNTKSVHHIHIQKLAQPQTILETETVAARYTSNSGQSIGTSSTALEFEDKEDDTHNAYDTSTGIYTIPITGRYLVSTGIVKNQAESSIYLHIAVDGTNKHTAVSRGSSVTSRGVNLAIYLTLNKGQEVSIKGSANSAGNLVTASEQNYFSIIRVK